MERIVTPISLDALDIKLVDALRRKPTSSNADLARLLGVAKTTVGLRLSRLAGAGVLRIVGVTDPATVGYKLGGLVLLQSRNRNFDDIAAELVRIPEALVVGSLVGAYQGFVSLMARDTRHLAALIEEEIAKVAGISAIRPSLYLELFVISPDTKTIRLDNLSAEARLAEIELTDLKETRDQIDRWLLAEFQNDGRVTYRDLARKYDIPESTVRARAKRLEDAGEVRFAGVADPFFLGFTHTAFLIIQTEVGETRKIARKLSEDKRFMLVASAIGPANLIASANFMTREEMAQTAYQNLPGMAGVVSVEVLELNEVYKQLLGWSRFSAVAKAPRKGKHASGR